ncbi:MAG: AAA family ATPase [Chloroflexota bacterium]|nr:AAA family ATPase [Chloroflexota bacterium]
MMALNDFYGFHQTPFTKSIAAENLYPSQGHQEVQGRLTFALQERLPALITGDVGTGKSTALRAFAQSLDRNVYRVVYLSNPSLTTPSLYRQILVGLQVEPAFGFRRLLPQFHAAVADLARKGCYVLLIVDEAHLLPPELFDQLRFLLNQDMDSASTITLVLLGQPDLAHKLRFAPYEALYQRIAVRYHLPPFDLEETAAYIKHHLRVAGFQGALFSDSFITGVYDHTKGVARKINNLCRSALLLGASESKQILDETDLKRVVLDLEGPTS